MYGELLNKSAMFSFNSVNVGALSLVNEDSIIKLRSSVEDDDFSFGTIIDIDYVEYSCKEVHLHAPAEHTVNGKEYPVEV
jgi:carbonic anhydrase